MSSSLGRIITRSLQFARVSQAGMTAAVPDTRSDDCKITRAKLRFLELRMKFFINEGDIVHNNLKRANILGSKKGNAARLVSLCHGADVANRNFLQTAQVASPSSLTALRTKIVWR